MVQSLLQKYCIAIEHLDLKKTTFRPFSWIALTVTISVKTYAKIPQIFVKVSHVMYNGVN